VAGGSPVDQINRGQTEHSACDRMLGILRDKPSGDGLPTSVRVLRVFSEWKSLTISQSKRLGRREWRSIAPQDQAQSIQIVPGTPEVNVADAARRNRAAKEAEKPKDNPPPQQ
jgi:hypothetical protein